jgi:hypothetical protein
MDEQSMFKDNVRYDVPKKRGYKGIVRRLFNDAIKAGCAFSTWEENQGSLKVIVVSMEIN